MTRYSTDYVSAWLVFGNDRRHQLCSVQLHVDCWVKFKLPPLDNCNNSPLARYFSSFQLTYYYHWTATRPHRSCAVTDMFIRTGLLRFLACAWQRVSFFFVLTSRSAIADKPRCSVSNLWQKYECKKRASSITLFYGIRHLEMLNHLGVHINYHQLKHKVYLRTQVHLTNE